MESPLQTATADELSASEISQTPRHQQLIVTIFGLYARETGASLPVSSLVRLLGELGVEAAGVRSSVSRLKRRGILESTKAGGIASYAIVPGRVDMFTEGDTRIFSPSHSSAEDKWLLVVFSIPETIRVKRHILRTELTRMGFGSVTSGVWIAPERTWVRAKQQLDRLGLENIPYNLQGPPIGRNFALKFTGNLQMAAQRAKKANMLLRNKETNEWEKMFTKTPENEDAKIFIGPDRAPKLKREIQLAKRLHKAFEAVHNDIKSYYNPRNYHVCIDKKPIAKVSAASFESFQVQWIDEHITQFKLDRDKILRDFDAHTGTAPNYTYSV